ncbi:MAG: hypothetical protein IKI59_04675 [Clostridia bacterium]|jgi:hypothetical protein|nr:hypothetical protein [Clostridia bacterium]
MEDGLKNNWKKVGKDFATLGKDFGKTLLKTVKTGVDAATEWVDKEEKNAQPADPVVTEAEQAQADTAKPVEKI